MKAYLIVASSVPEADSHLSYGCQFGHCLSVMLWWGNITCACAVAACVRSWQPLLLMLCGTVFCSVKVNGSGTFWHGSPPACDTNEPGEVGDLEYF